MEPQIGDVWALDIDGRVCYRIDGVKLPGNGGPSYFYGRAIDGSGKSEQWLGDVGKWDQPRIWKGGLVSRGGVSQETPKPVTKSTTRLVLVHLPREDWS